MSAKIRRVACVFEARRIEKVLPYPGLVILALSSPRCAIQNSQKDPMPKHTLFHSQSCLADGKEILGSLS